MRTRDAKQVLRQPYVGDPPRSTVAETTGPRRAYVIGNTAYPPSTGDRLRNPVNDARAIDEKLKDPKFGFSSNGPYLDQTKSDFEDRLKEIKRESPGSVVLIYFAGHGVSALSDTVLLPSDFDPGDRSGAVLDQYYISHAISLTRILDAVKHASYAIVILDSCRTRRSRHGAHDGVRSAEFRNALNQGFNNVHDSTLHDFHGIIQYSAAVGQAASDGDGPNSPYMRALLEHIESPEPISTVLQAVDMAVRNDTGLSQRPQTRIEVTRPLCLLKTPTTQIQTSTSDADERVSEDSRQHSWVRWKKSALLIGSAIVSSVAVGMIYYWPRDLVSQTPRSELAIEETRPSASESKALSLETRFASLRQVGTDDQLRAFGEVNSQFKARVESIIAERKSTKARREEVRSDDLAFNVADQVGTMDAYEGYLRKFPNGRHGNPARERMAALRLLEKRFDELSRSGDIEGLKTFAEENSRYSGKALSRINELQAQRVRKEREEEARAAKAEAERRKKKEAADNQAFQKARRENTQAAYSSYLTYWPTGQHRAEAEGKIRIMLAQELMRALGCYSGGIDGDFGPASERAWRRAMRTNEKKADISENDLKRLRTVSHDNCKRKRNTTPPSTPRARQVELKPRPPTRPRRSTQPRSSGRGPNGEREVSIGTAGSVKPFN